MCVVVSSIGSSRGPTHANLSHVSGSIDPINHKCDLQGQKCSKHNIPLTFPHAMSHNGTWPSSRGRIVAAMFTACAYGVCSHIVGLKSGSLFPAIDTGNYCTDARKIGKHLGFYCDLFHDVQMPTTGHCAL